MKKTLLNVNPLDQREMPAILASVSYLVPEIVEGGPGSVRLATAEILLSGPANKPVTFSYTSVGAANGNTLTASSGTDFTYTSDTVTFAPGQTRKLVSVPVLGDGTYENDETFAMRITHLPPTTFLYGADPYPQILVQQPQTTFTIKNDDPMPPAPLTLGATGAQVSQLEGNLGTSNTILATVSLNRPSAYVVTVNYATQTGTANSTDYRPVSGTITFLPGEVSKQIAIALIGDNTYEANETFHVKLSNPQGANIGVGQATFTILNDDTLPPPPPRFTNFVTTRTNANGGLDWSASRPGGTPVTLPRFGLAGDVTVMGDWNGDGTSDLGVARRNMASGLMDWYLDLNGDGYLAEHIVSFGFATDTPLAGDMNGDRRADLIAVRANPQTGLLQWFVDAERNGYTGELPKNYGWNTDQPIIGDWNRDGCLDMGVTRNVNGTRQWLLDKNNGIDTAAEEVFLLGAWSDQAVAGDWNNDGITDVGIVRQGNDGQLYWYLDTNNDRNADIAFAFGNVGDCVLTGVL